MKTSIIHIIVTEYGWIHLSLGLFGNCLFFTGSLLFLPALEEYKTIGVWLFILGAFFMIIGSLGKLLVDIVSNQSG